jgi:hypothetical protein
MTPKENYNEADIFDFIYTEKPKGDMVQVEVKYLKNNIYQNTYFLMLKKGFTKQDLKDEIKKL